MIKEQLGNLDLLLQTTLIPMALSFMRSQASGFNRALIIPVGDELAFDASFFPNFS